MVVFCLIVSLFHCSFVSLFHCFIVSLFHGFIVSLFHCLVIAGPQPEEGPGANWGAAPAGFGTHAPTKGRRTPMGKPQLGMFPIGAVSHFGSVRFISLLRFIISTNQTQTVFKVH